MLSRLAILCFLLTIGLKLTAQDKLVGSVSEPVSAIKELRKGTLIVRLPSNQRKMKALKEALEKDDNSSQREKWLQRELEATQEETQTFNNTMFRAFGEAYDFSAVQFTYDYLTPELKAGNFQGNLLNEELEPSSAIALEKSPAFILSFGRTNKDYSDGVEAMVILGEQLKSPPPPFPYYQRLNDLQAFWGNIFPRSDQELFDAMRLVGKLNKKLHKFYNRNVGATDSGE